MPVKANGNAVVILPGGGYEAEAIYYEGFEIAQALASRGTTAAVLKYRLPNPETATKPENVPLSDVRRALHLLRENQAHYDFSARRFGVLGFSAGSHLATNGPAGLAHDQVAIGVLIQVIVTC